jgi:tetratricopeptide (TPR) repeat protein
MSIENTTTEKIDDLLSQANTIRNNNPKDAIKLCKDALKFSESINYTRGSARSNQIAAICSRQMSEYDNAFEYNEKALALYKLLEDVTEQSRVINSIANVYYNLSKFNYAIEYFNICINILEKLKDHKFLINVLSNKGLALQESGDIEKSLECYLKSLKISKENDLEVPYNLLNNIGIAYQVLGDYNASLNYFNSALKIEESKNLLQEVSFTLGNIGITFSKLEDYTNAITYLSEALIIIKNTSNKFTEANIYLNLGISLRNAKYFPDAFKYLNRALKYFTEINDKSSLAETLYEIGVLNFELNDYKNSNDKFIKGINIAEEIKDTVNLIKCKVGQAKIYRKFKDYEKAITYLNTAKDLSMDIKDLNKLTEICTHLKTWFTETGNYDQAILALEEYYYFIRRHYEINDEREINNIMTQSKLLNDTKTSKQEYMYAL